MRGHVTMASLEKFRANASLTEKFQRALSRIMQKEKMEEEAKGR